MGHEHALSRIMISTDITADEVEVATKHAVNELSRIRLGGLDSSNGKIVKLLNAVRCLEKIYLVQKLSFDIDSEHNKSWVCELLEDVVGPKIKTLENKERIGCFVEMLRLCGSPNCWAQEATAEWLGISETTVRNSQSFFLKYCTPKNRKLTTDELMRHQSDNITFLLNSTKKAFPNSNIKAQKAFERLKVELADFEKEYLNFFYERHD